MHIKIGKLEISIPAWALIAGALIGDSMYANHCKKKSYDKFADSVTKVSNSDNEKES